MVVLLLESHQTHVPFLWLYLAGFPLQSCQNDLNRSGDSSLYAAAVPWQPSVHELAPAGHVAHSVREVLLSARSRRYPRSPPYRGAHLEVRRQDKMRLASWLVLPPHAAHPPWRLHPALRSRCAPCSRSSLYDCAKKV